MWYTFSFYLRAVLLGAAPAFAVYCVGLAVSLDPIWLLQESQEMQFLRGALASIFFVIAALSLVYDN